MYVFYTAAIVYYRQAVQLIPDIEFKIHSKDASRHLQRGTECCTRSIASFCLLFLVVHLCSLLLCVELGPDEEMEGEEGQEEGEGEEEERRSEDVSHESVAAIDSVSILAENLHHMMLHEPVCQPARPMRVCHALKRVL